MKVWSSTQEKKKRQKKERQFETEQECHRCQRQRENKKRYFQIAVSQTDFQ